MVPFSRRELRNAWSLAYRISRVMPRSNAHRLMLFYAIECGLKAVWLKRNGLDILEVAICERGTDKPVKHDINKLLDNLLAGKELRLPAPLGLNELRRSGAPGNLARQCAVGDLNQVWRYGGVLAAPNTDGVLEQALENVHTWLIEELR